MLKRTVFAAIGLIGINNASFAQDNIDVSQGELKRLLSTISVLSADFAQTVYDQNEVVYEAQGHLYLSRPGKVRWETEFPDEALLIADGEAIWNIDSFVEQVTVFDQAQAVNTNPIVLLTSQDDEVWQQFSIQQTNVSDESLVTGADNVYTIESLNQDAQIRTLSLYLRGDAIFAISTLDAQAQISVLALSNLDTSSPLKNDLFNVTIPDSYTIDDER